MARKIFKKVKHWYEYYERRIALSFLMGGFVLDYFTLPGIDTWSGHLWIALGLILAGICIIVLNRKKGADNGFWFPNILQFSFGALLGSLFVFYLRSSTISAAWPFLLVIVLVIFSNELFQKRYARLALQLSFFYFSLLSFSIVLLPVIMRSIGVQIFLFSTVSSLIIFWIFLRILSFFAREAFIESKTRIWTLVMTVFVGVNLLYFTNIIPPVPLSVKDAGIYYEVRKEGPDGYELIGEERTVENFLSLWPEVYWEPGKPLYAYTAIFSPGSLDIDVLHDWQYQNEGGRWVTATRIPLHLAGGRVEGFRTYSTKYNFTPGKWRVDVKTTRGQIIGRINFKVVVK